MKELALRTEGTIRSFTMSTYSILYWQEIPSMVEATDGGVSSKLQLSIRFQELIDKVAMRRGLAGTDAYIEGFHRSEALQLPGTPEEVASSVKDRLEEEYDSIESSALRKPEQQDSN